MRKNYHKVIKMENIVERSNMFDTIFNYIKSDIFDQIGIIYGLNITDTLLNFKFFKTSYSFKNMIALINKDIYLNNIQETKSIKFLRKYNNHYLTIASLHVYKTLYRDFKVLSKYVDKSDSLVTSMITLTYFCFELPEIARLNHFITEFSKIHAHYYNNNINHEYYKISRLEIDQKCIDDYFDKKIIPSVFRTIEIKEGDELIKNRNYSLFDKIVFPTNSDKIRNTRDNYFKQFNDKLNKLVCNRLHDKCIRDDSYLIRCYEEACYCLYPASFDEDFENVKLIYNKLCYTNTNSNVFYITQHSQYVEKIKEVANKHTYFFVLNIPYSIQKLLVDYNENTFYNNYKTYLTDGVEFFVDEEFDTLSHIYLFDLAMLRNKFSIVYKRFYSMINYEEEFIIFSNDMNDLLMNLNYLLYYLTIMSRGYSMQFNHSIFRSIDFYSKIDYEYLEADGMRFYFDQNERKDLVLQWLNFYESYIDLTAYKKNVKEIEDEFINIQKLKPARSNSVSDDMIKNKLDIKKVLRRSVSTDYLNIQIKKHQQYELYINDRNIAIELLKQKYEYETKEFEDGDLTIYCPNCLKIANSVLQCTHCFCEECIKDMTKCYICDMPVILKSIIYQS